MSLPKTPEGWAFRLSQVVKIFHDTHGLDRFPINVTSVAMDFSRQVFPDAPITKVEGLCLSGKFEGMLMPHPSKNGEWGIVYNSAISSKGRINFTLGHELGHYLLHRHLSPEGIQCTKHDMLNWKSEYAKIEAQANIFASFLLMPLDDFRKQSSGHDPSIDLMRHLASRYEVSLTAAILKWLEFTTKRAMIVVGKDGFIDWAWSSEALLKSGVFYRARQEVIPLPEQSLAARRDQPAISETSVGVVHAKGIWAGNEEVREMTIFSAKPEISVTLLIYPDASPRGLKSGTASIDEPTEWDTYDQFLSNRRETERL